MIENIGFVYGIKTKICKKVLDVFGSCWCLYNIFETDLHNPFPSSKQTSSYVSIKKVTKTISVSSLSFLFTFSFASLNGLFVICLTMAFQVNKLFSFWYYHIFEIYVLHFPLPFICSFFHFVIHILTSRQARKIEFVIYKKNVSLYLPKVGKLYLHKHSSRYSLDVFAFLLHFCEFKLWA